jgi:hypothetical protein
MISHRPEAASTISNGGSERRPCGTASRGCQWSADTGVTEKLYQVGPRNTRSWDAEPPVGTVPAATRTLLIITFKGRMTRADRDSECTTPGRLAREARGRPPGPVSRGTRRRAAARPAHADTESLTQNGPAVGGCSGAGLPEGGNLHDPLLSCGGTEGLRPSRYTSGPGVGQQQPVTMHRLGVGHAIAQALPNCIAAVDGTACQEVPSARRPTTTQRRAGHSAETRRTT